LTAWKYDFASNSAYLATGNPTNLSLLMKDNARILKDLPTSIFPNLAPESFETVKQFYSQVRSGSPSCSCEIWFLDRQGGGRHCEKLSMTTVYDENKQPLRAYGIGQDITAEKTKEEKFNEALLALDEAHSFTLGSVRLNFTKDKVEDFRGINPSILSEHAQGSVREYFQAFAKLIPDPLTQETFLRESEPAVLLKAFHEGKTRFSIEYPALGPKGVTLWREALLFLIENPNSGDIEGVTYAIDITERKKNEAIIAHLTSQEFDYIALIDSLEGTIEFENKQSNITFGAVFEPKPYEEWRKYLKSHFLNPQELENYQSATALKTIVAELVNKNEYVFSYDQFENGVRSRRQLQYSWLNQNRGLIISLRKDITASYEQEQNQLALLRVALNKAEAPNAAKTEFLSRISHDIRTPISIITNMTAFAFEDIDQKDKLKDDLRKIETSNTFLLSLINDVLDISKIDAGKIELHLEPYAFDNYVPVIRNMFVDVCKSKGLEFTVETEGDPAPIMTDHIRLNQITLNLLSNAVKYTPKGGKILFRAGSQPQADGNLACRIEVKDNGIGMSPDFQKQLFQAFSQDYDNPYRNKASSGTGLGLAIVKRLVDLIGG
jgi:signal transduction histidine kinase